MAAATIDFHPEARAEIVEAACWYAERSAHAADAFLADIDRAIEAVCEAPERWPEHKYTTRRYLLRRFPYLIVYQVAGDHVVVVAVAHGRRRPGYWKQRAT